MQDRLTAVLFLSLLSFHAQAFEADVIRVMDGDTVMVKQINGQSKKCRLYGIDAPETSQPFGPESKNKLSSIVMNRTIQVVETSQDRYGRSICKISIDKQDVNLEMVKKGLAWVYRAYTSDPIYIKAEDDARANKIGLWKDNKPVPPWDYRKQKRSEYEKQ
ncbi:hypothetical protein BUE93_22050 [Chromobacterium amazonense]|uniref:TNase-like domain-containing protein n=1 Tax=Chromobacterium amazonense TaxID=1382803 RepID=A0A2S9WYE3_9NEIS|nr:thermonuclease family protein [Chromobacterium amazonense]PRP68487.1 hypothetical protein BUE93_22050 [Chromobacterium amazonense]